MSFRPAPETVPPAAPKIFWVRWTVTISVAFLAIVLLVFVFRTRGDSSSHLHDPVISVQMREKPSKGTSLKPGVLGLDSKEKPAPQLEAASELQTWLDGVRVEIGKYPPGTAQYKEYLRALQNIFRQNAGSILNAKLVVEQDEGLPYFGKTLIVTALSRIENPELAHRLLRELAVSSSISDNLKISVVGLLSIPAGAPQETLDLLANLAKRSEGLGAVALEALATLADRLVKGGDPRGRSFLNEWILQYSKCEFGNDMAGAQKLIYAISQVNAPESVAAIRTALRHDSPQIRIAAVTGMGLLDPIDRYPAVLQVFQSESNRDVLVECLRALYPCPGKGLDLQPQQNKRIPEDVPVSLCRALFTQKDETVRLAILEFFEICYKESFKPPESVTPILREVATRDPSEQVRGHAHWVLQYSLGEKD
jgi:hypothetical protein